jgi:hypothetical protein
VPVPVSFEFLRNKEARMMKFNTLLLLLILTAICLFPGQASASNWGLRMGFALTPDDFLIGAHYRTDPIADHLYFVPSFEVGVGDITMLAGNADLHYVFQTDTKVKPYAGGGATFNWFDFAGGSNSEFGGSLLGGVMLGHMKNGSSVFLEAKVGLGDVPDAKFIVGWNLR